MSQSGKRIIRDKGIIQTIWENFWKSLSISSRRNVVGKDQHGNIYYDSAPGYATRAATQRGYVPSDDSKWEVIPVEWEAWLRGRRQEPPTEEEIQQNTLKSESVVAKANILNAQYGASLDQTSTSSHALVKTDETNQKKVPRDSRSSTAGPTEFPTYKDFELMPGVSSTDDDNPKNKSQ